VADSFILGFNFLLIPSYNKQNLRGKSREGGGGGGGRREVGGRISRTVVTRFQLAGVHQQQKQNRKGGAVQQPCFSSSSTITSSATATVNVIGHGG